MNSDSDPQTTTADTREGVAYIEKYGAGWKLVFKQHGPRHDGTLQFPKISFIESGPEKLGAPADGKLDVESSVPVVSKVQDEVRPNLNSNHRILKPKSSGKTILNDTGSGIYNRSKTFQPSKKVKHADYPRFDVQSESDPDKQHTQPGSLESHAPEESIMPNAQAVNMKPYKCQICQSSYSRLEFYKYHVKTHEKAETTSHCTVCSKVFPNQLKLTIHYYYHRREKYFKCKLCDKSFSLPSNLNIHMRSHTGERPYNCHYCGKAFSQIGNLNVHLKIHTGEKLH